MCFGEGRFKRPKGNKLEIRPNGRYLSEQYRKNRDFAKKVQDKVDECREKRKPLPKGLFFDKRVAVISKNSKDKFS